MIRNFFNGITRMFRSASLNNPNLSLSDPRLWAEAFGTTDTETGETMTASKAMQCAAVFQCVQLISSDLASMSKCLNRRRPGLGDDAPEEMEDHPLHRLINCRPNEYQDAVTFWSRVFSNMLIYPRAYVEIERDGGNNPVGLHQLRPDQTTLECGPIHYVITRQGGTARPIELRNVLTFEFFNDGISDRGIIDVARNSIALAIAQEKFASRFFRNGGRVGGILELPAAMPKAARDTVEEGFRKSYEGTDNPFKTVVLRDNAKFHTAQQSPHDSQLVESSEAQVRQIARWFNLPPSKLGLSDSVSYNSKYEDNQSYLSQTLNPLMTKVEGQLNHKLLTESQSNEMFFRFEREELLEMKPQEKATYLSTLVASELINRNEGRLYLGYPPYEGGDEFGNPNTSTSQSAEPAVDPATEEPPAEPDESNSKKYNVRRVVYGIARHAREKAKNDRAFIEWIDGGLQSHRQEAKELLGDETIVVGALAEFKLVAETTSTAALSGAVESIATKLEQGV